MLCLVLGICLTDRIQDTGGQAGMEDTHDRIQLRREIGGRFLIAVNVQAMRSILVTYVP